jgi:Fe-S-cluster-containing dehydrogenase component
MLIFGGSSNEEHQNRMWRLEFGRIITRIVCIQTGNPTFLQHCPSKKTNVSKQGTVFKSVCLGAILIVLEKSLIVNCTAV